MKRYAWITAVCLAALMVSGCGDQKGQTETSSSGSTSKSTTVVESQSEEVSGASSEEPAAEPTEEPVAEEEEKSGASVVKLAEGEVYRDDLDGDGQEEEFSFTFEGDGKNGDHQFEQYSYTMQMTCDGQMQEKELYGGYEATWMIQSAEGEHYLYQESYSENGLYFVTVFHVTADEITETGKADGRVGDDGIEDVNAFPWVSRVDMLGTYRGTRTVGVGADGLPEAKEEAYTIEWMTKPLKIKEGKTLTAEILNDNGEAESIVLTGGTELTPKMTDGTTYVDAELADGTLCRIEVETGEGFPHTIHGVDESEYFELLPYAG